MQGFSYQVIEGHHLVGVQAGAQPAPLALHSVQSVVDVPISTSLAIHDPSEPSEGRCTGRRACLLTHQSVFT